jgi:hypothetical protein
MSKQNRAELKKQFTAVTPATKGQAQQSTGLKAIATNSTPDEVRAAKRSKFLAEDKPRRGNSLLYVLIPALLVVLLGGGFFLLRGNSNASSIPLANQLASQSAAAPAGDAQVVGFIGGINSPLPNKQYPAIKADNGEIHIPTSIFEDRKAHFYSTTLPDGQPINFFILKSADGVIRAAIDACDVCYAARKGYHQDGDDLVCNNCGLHFPSNRINEVKGGCNPSPLTRTVEGNSVVIKISDLVRDNQAANGQPLF